MSPPFHFEAAFVPFGTRLDRLGPEPPASLDSLEKQIWRDVVDALPAHWLDLAGQLVLRRLVAQAAIARLCQLRAQQKCHTSSAMRHRYREGRIVSDTAL